MRDADDTSRREKVLKILKDGRTGILSTMSTDVQPFGYPLGSVISFVVDPSNEIIFFASNLAEYTRNFTISERVCLTILKQNKDDECNVLFGINYFGKVRLLKEGEIPGAIDRYIARFPQSRMRVSETENNFYRISLNQIKYFDEDGTFTLTFE